MSARADIESLGVIGEDGRPMRFMFNGQRHAGAAIAGLAIDTRNGTVTHAGWTVADLRALAAVLPEGSRVQLPVASGEWSRDVRGNVSATSEDDVFVRSVFALLHAALRWEVFEVSGLVTFANWYFRHNEPVGDPGVIVTEPGGPPRIALEGTTFEKCTPLSLVETLLYMAEKAEAEAGGA